ncbi:HDOD domain-containing protein [Xylophilus sp. Kf1]|nr:HDOD domain-containing protein [Xylophilus sp. Kf1]
MGLKDVHSFTRPCRPPFVPLSAVAPMPPVSESLTSPTPPTPGARRDAALEFLLRRMRHRSDFPALSESVARILKTTGSEDDSLADLTGEILEDVALTHKLLRLVNSAQFMHLGQGGTISTVSRAVSLVGFNTVRNMALSLVLLDHMEDKAHAQQLKQEFVKGLMAGSVAGEIAPASRESEGAFIGALFQNLGRMLVTFYFREEDTEIRTLMVDPAFEGDDDAAALQVLGLTHEDLALGVAQAWGLPESLQRAMRKPVGTAPVRAPDDAGERLRWIGAVANEVARAAMAFAPAELPVELARIARKYASVVTGGTDGLIEAATRAHRKLVALTDAMQLQVVAGSPAARLLQSAPVMPADDTPATAPLTPAEARTVEEKRVAYAQARSARAEAASGQGRDAIPAVSTMLAAGVQEVVDAMSEPDFRLDDVLRRILTTMYRSLGFRQVVLCLRDARTDEMRGRFGVGENHAQAVNALRVPLDTAGDLFAAICRKGGDLLMADTSEPQSRSKLPGWYLQSFTAGAFVLLPLMHKGRPLGLIYADHASAGGIVMDEKGFALLRTLRNQAVMAFRQAS